MKNSFWCCAHITRCFLRQCAKTHLACVGMLSHWIQKSMQDKNNVDFLLVDRASTRYKVKLYCDLKSCTDDQFFLDIFLAMLLARVHEEAVFLTNFL